MPRVRINVTQEHLDRGGKHTYDCPIWQALHEQGFTNVEVDDWINYDGQRQRTSRRVQRFIRANDSLKGGILSLKDAVKRGDRPFYFYLEVPDGE